MIDMMDVIFLMSIYSGFATRTQQECYDQCVDSLLYVLQRRIIKFYKNQDADQQKFISLVLKMHNQLKLMESNKYLEPKSSIATNQLVKFMANHQKNMLHQKYKTTQRSEHLMTHQALPVVEHKQNNDQSVTKKKESMWVQKKIPKIQNKMIDQEMQTMGVIYEKKDSNSPKQSTIAGHTIQRQAINGLRTKYGQKMSYGRKQRGSQNSQGIIQTKNRSQSHYLPRDVNARHNFEVNNHLKQMETHQKKRRKQKYNSRLGIKDQRDLNSEQQNSEYEVGDIIKDYLTRVKKKYVIQEKHAESREVATKMGDF